MSVNLALLEFSLILLVIGLVGKQLEQQLNKIRQNIIDILYEEEPVWAHRHAMKKSIEDLSQQINGFNTRLSHQERNYQGDADMLKILEGGKQ